MIANTEPKDLPSILALQKLCYRKAAERYHDYSIPPLTQTLDELMNDHRRCVMLKMEHDSRIIGSVRAYERNGTLYIGRVIVHPDFQNRGFGKSLMLEIERRFPNAVRFELFTGCRDEKNKYFYGRLGYRIFREEPERRLVFLEKFRR